MRQKNIDSQIAARLRAVNIDPAAVVSAAGERNVSPNAVARLMLDPKKQHLLFLRIPESAATYYRGLFDSAPGMPSKKQMLGRKVGASKTILMDTSGNDIGFMESTNEAAQYQRPGRRRKKDARNLWVMMAETHCPGGSVMRLSIHPDNKFRVTFKGGVHFAGVSYNMDSVEYHIRKYRRSLGVEKKRRPESGGASSINSTCTAQLNTEPPSGGSAPSIQHGVFTVLRGARCGFTPPSPDVISPEDENKHQQARKRIQKRRKSLSNRRSDPTRPGGLPAGWWETK